MFTDLFTTFNFINDNQTSAMSDLGGRILEGPANDVFVSDLMTGKHFYCLGLSKIKFLSVLSPLRPLSEGSLIIVNKVKSRKQIGKHFCSFLFMLNDEINR
jgi:hypothetical protein